MFGRALRTTAAVAMVAGVTVMVDRPESLFSFSRWRDTCRSSWSGSVMRGIGGNSSRTGVSSVDEYMESVEKSAVISCILGEF